MFTGLVPGSIEEERETATQVDGFHLVNAVAQGDLVRGGGWANRHGAYNSALRDGVVAHEVPARGRVEADGLVQIEAEAPVSSTLSESSASGVRGLSVNALFSYAMPPRMA